MTYVKPQVTSICDAVSAVQSMPLIKGTVDAFDSNINQPQKNTISAYEGDE